MPKKTQFIIGTSGWNYNDWRGIFYPKDLPKNKWLLFYEKSFQVVEINSTFYRFFNDNVFIKWRLLAHNNFKYIVKVPQVITHKKYLLHCTRMIKKFCRLTNLLEDKLALILLQLPPNMPYEIKRLRKAILTFDDPKKIVVEFRDKKWFTPEVKKMLKEIGCVFCATDSPKTTLQNWVISKVGYIRLHGTSEWFNYKYSQKELRGIANFAHDMSKNGAEKIYILFNNDYYAYAIKNAISLNKLLNKKP